MSQAEQPWPHKFDVAINPAARRPLMIMLGFGLLAVVLYIGISLLDGYRYSQEQESLVPRMSELAVQGVPEAIAWMIKNKEGYYNTPEGKAQLKLAAEAGHPQSMFFYASIHRKDNPDLAKDYLQRAADAGYPRAVQMMEKWKHRTD
ncbi:hypothetical protein [Pseudomonas sp. EMN2]|uniref:hypothetical protein n=1 Tax=Pseudomonas sp. EMN2 TaxID=2615212 RepID=UPI00129BF9AC|nr:hypothetical protein [Pseudomonas sp. EMN2]